MKPSTPPPPPPATASEEARLHFYRERLQEHTSQYAGFHAPSVDALVTLVDAHHVIWTTLARALAEHDISPSALNLLGILKRCGPEGCPLGELSSLMLVTPPGITGLVDSLVRRGLVERRVHSNDRRVRLACITQAGQDLVHRVLPSHFETIRAMFASLSEVELKDLADLLARVSQGLRSQGTLSRAEGPSPTP